MGRAVVPEVQGVSYSDVGIDRMDKRMLMLWVLLAAPPMPGLMP